MIDFSSCKRLVNNYDGADMKQRIEYNGQIYMLKFGQKLESNEKKPLQASYSSAPISEWLGCNVFSIVGKPFKLSVQETLLGTFGDKIVVACKDFIANRPDSNTLCLLEFKKLENSYLDSSTAGGRTPLYDNLMEIYQNHPSLSSIRELAITRYWQMFAIDALIGNFDRHAGNWGYIYNLQEDRIVDLAPVYDCGSSFYPQLDESAMYDFVKNPKTLEERVKTFPTAALRVDGKKVRYHEFLLSDKGAAARAAAATIMQSVDFSKIDELIESIPSISEVRKEFLHAQIAVRKDVILLPAYRLYEKERGRLAAHDLSHSCPSLQDACNEMKDSARQLATQGPDDKAPVKTSLR